ncbi:MAG: TaqI-like C-terminal specificity domain-containing protein [Candidatus Roizmanbacteria bacterium]
MINFNETYNTNQFLTFVQDFLPEDFVEKEEDIVLENGKEISKARILGTCDSLDITIMEMEHKSDTDKRVAITKDAFKILANHWIHRALVIFKNMDSDNYRFSLLTISLDLNDKNKVIKSYSNARRYSFFLGPGAKVNTPYKFLITKGRVTDLTDLKNRFSVEVVNKEFYKEISQAYIQLVGGTGATGVLVLPSVQQHSQTHLEFAVRLIGRIIFCWFLREKKTSTIRPLMPIKLLSLTASQSISNYYHLVLEPIFFEILNKQAKSRVETYNVEPFSDIPYLNGGLFSPQDDDFYGRNEKDRAINQNILFIPDSWFISFFEVLEKYNFTIDENTSYDEELSIDPEMLGRIFENLLAEINPETGESARKSTGSFYTPRMIVDYMVDESLYLYLKQKTNLDEKQLRALISYDLDDDALHPLQESDKEHIAQALSTVKILDPACGSGAFPIGALQKIVFILQQIDKEGKLWFKKLIQNMPIEMKRVLEREYEHRNFDYLRKLGVIRENIYGVDIQPIATEISRLRCFLTLVVEQRIDDTLENRGIEPLPNLDFKFVTANTLVGLPIINEENPELFDNSQKIHQLKDLRDQYFSARSEERKDVMLAFADLQSEMINELIAKHSFTGVTKADLTRKLTEWKPFKHKVADWFDSEWMFGIKKGFDIVIANPPYVQIQKFSGQEIQETWKSQKYVTFQKTGDIYALFIEKGMAQLREHGILTYITSNKWMRAGYGKSLRNFLATKTQPLKLIDFGGYQVFESATVDSDILITAKTTDKSPFYACAIKPDFTTEVPLSVYFDAHAQTMPTMSGDVWTISTGIDQQIKAKIEAIGTPLKDWDVKINYGIKTGFNEAFIIDTPTKNRLCEEDPKSAKIIKPVLRGRDIKRYKAEWAGLWLISTFPALQLNIDDFQAVKKHLLSFGYERLEQSGKKYNEITSRKKTSNKWFELQDTIAYWKEFEKEKIMYREISNSMDAIYTNDEIYCNNKIYIITGESIKLLLSILNSKLFNCFILKSANITGGKGESYISQIPIPKLSTTDQAPFITLVDSILQGKKDGTDTSEMEHQIDQMVYKLYNITEEEIAVIEGKK